MQTNTWTPPGAETAKRPRPGWLEVLGWYAGGAAATGFLWLLGGPVAGSLRGPLGQLAGTMLALLEIVLLVAVGRGRHRRCRVALVLGALTPIVLMALFLIWLIWAFAHSNWTF